jgi:S1-C subfamily serine protease
MLSCLQSSLRLFCPPYTLNEHRYVGPYFANELLNSLGEQMSDFEDYDDDTPSEGCDVCGDPLCPGCEPSVQGRLLKLALFPVAIVVLALIFRFMFLGGSGDGEEVSQIETVPPAETVVEETTTSTTTTQPSTTTPVIATPIAIAGGVLTEDTIRSVVQVVQIDARGPCGWGSGTVVGDSLTVLTNVHVIETTEDCPNPRLEIWIVSALDERPSPAYNAEVVVTDEEADLAILRLTPKSNSAIALQPVPIRSSASVGEEIFIIGFPNIGGSSITISKGIVSGFTKEQGVSWIKTDASISGGNSGGAAVNGKGELVGVPTMASAGEDGEVVDCRPVTDTNRDGQIDRYDDCVPIGGFLNLLSPTSRAEALLRQANTSDLGDSDDPSTEGGDESPDDESADWDDSESNDPRFSTCKEALRNGYGPYYDGVDPEYNWYIDADSDGVVCER